MYQYQGTVHTVCTNAKDQSDLRLERLGEAVGAAIWQLHLFPLETD